MSKKVGSFLNLFIALSMVISMFAVTPAYSSAPPQDEGPQFSAFRGSAVPNKEAAAQKDADKAASGAGITREQALAKMHPNLRPLAETAAPPIAADLGNRPAPAGQDAVFISVYAYLQPGEKALAEYDIAQYFVDQKVMTRPPVAIGDSQLVISFGYIQPSNLVKLASVGQVETMVLNELVVNGQPDDYPIDDAATRPVKGPEDWAALRGQADALRVESLDWSEAKAFGDGRALPALPDGPAPDDYFDAFPEGPHMAQTAWERGYTGQGVSVAVIDDGVDFAHPDLLGTQKIYSSTVAPEYNGWPYVFSPISMLLYARDNFLGETNIADGYPGAHYVDTSFAPTLSNCGAGLRCFDYTPLIDFGVLGYNHTYVMDAAMSKSGVVHVGTHPDNDLRDFVWGEKPAVLVVDSVTPGVYDTVYVDLDNDYDFRDEKPLRRADTSSAAALEATKNDMVSYRDMNGDGLADLSGGALYFIADGVTYIPVSDWLWGLPFTPPPANGELVAFVGPTFDRDYSHGTQCASNIAGQGVTDALLPEFIDLPPSPGPNPATGAVFGMAPDSKIVTVADIYYNFDPSKIDAYTFAAVGYDGYVSNSLADSDAIQITTNSYGASDADNDGWEFDGQYVSQVMRQLASQTQFTFSTGNGAPGYGTTAPPSPDTAISVGASTLYGSTGWDTITSTLQLNYNDVTSFSNRGPGARGTAGVDVVANGARGAGAEALNYYAISTWGVLDGNLSWVTWGGTSRSAPVAGGVLALLYQAYYDANGDWPDWETAKALMKSSSTDLNYDAFTQGAGSVNADRGTLLASGEYGVFALPDEWNPGDFRGESFPAFAHLVKPGETHNQTVTVVNPSAAPITVGVGDGELVEVGSETFNYTITPEMFAAKPVDNFFKAPQFIIPITAEAGKISANAWWDNLTVPADTDLMIVRMRYPFSEFDVEGDYNADNRFRLAVYNWMDVNGDGDVWDDANGNGVVDFTTLPDVTQIDGAQELDWATAEVDRWEYARFDYNRPGGNVLEQWVHNPTDRMLDGLFIGIQQYDTSTVAETNFTFEVDFYRYEDAAWLAADTTSLVVPAGGTATFDAQIDVPADLPAGMYQAMLKITDPGDGTNAGHVTAIPVAMNVGADFTPGMTLGGTTAYQGDTDKPYNNGAVRGNIDWTWRPESGDWRFFFVDVNNQPDYPAIYMSEAFEGAFPPAGWARAENIGTCDWESTAVTGYGNLTGGSGAAADANSDLCFAAMDAELWSSAIDLTGATSPMLYYKHAFNALGTADSAAVDVSTDGGTTWANLTTFIADNTTPQAVDLTAYAGQTIHLRWHYIASDWNWYWQIDDVLVAEPPVLPFASDASLIVRDVWDSPAPSTDIDTIVLGPTPHSSDLLLSEPAYFGPYTLDTVGKSANMNLEAGVWAFDTTSGANEDWVAAPIQDGLHALLQHNVLFEGSEFWVPFTKTVGTMVANPQGFDIETYLDQGEVGVLTVESSLALNGLAAEAFLLDSLTTAINNEPIPFVAAGVIEWVYPFSVTDALELDVSTSSTGISDLDLYLFYNDGTGYAQVASSAGSDSNESVYLQNPPDGDYLVGIDNYSGPDGGLANISIDVRQKVGGLTVAGLPNGPVAADTPVDLTVMYDYPFEPGKTYTGSVFYGPPEAPNLQSVPVTITRLEDAVGVEKMVDQTTAFPGDELNYTIELFNLSDPDAIFDFVDAIPAGTSYVDATISGLDPVVVSVCELDEGFEAAVPPAGWAVAAAAGGAFWDTNVFWGRTNQTPGANGQAAAADADALGSGVGATNAELWTPAIDLTGATTSTLTFDSNFRFLTGSSANVDVSTDGGATWTNIWTLVVSDYPAGATYNLDLGAYLGQTIHLRFRYVADNWDYWWQVDDIVVTNDDPGCTPVVDDPWGDLVYDPVADAISYTGLLPLGSVIDGTNDEGFEAGMMPPDAWTVDSPGSSDRVWITVDAATLPDFVHSGAHAAWLNYPSAGLWDEWLISPQFIPAAGDSTFGFWGLSCTNPDWPSPYNMQVLVLDENGAVLETAWDMFADESWDCANFTYHEVTGALDAYIGQPIHLAWRGTGDAYASFGLDAVTLPGEVFGQKFPSAVVNLTVLVDDTVAPGDFITNTAEMEATHAMPQGDQVEGPRMADAVTHIGMEDFQTSYKEASPYSSEGDLIEYNIHVVNSGDALAAITLTDPIPAGTTFDSLDNSPPAQALTYDPVADAVTWSGNLTPGEERVFTFWVEVGAGFELGDIITNVATIEWNAMSMDLSATTEIAELPQLQVAHLAPFASGLDSAVTVTLDGAEVLTDFRFGDSTAYLPVPAGTHTVEILAGGAPVVSEVVTFEYTKAYLATAIGGANGHPVELLLFEDTANLPASGDATLRAGHLAPFAADLADTTADIRLDDGTAVLTDVQYTDAAYLALAPGAYDTQVTAPSGDPVLIDPAAFTLVADGLMSVFAVGDDANQPLGVYVIPAGEEGYFLLQAIDLYMPVVFK